MANKEQDEAALAAAVNQTAQTQREQRRYNALRTAIESVSVRLDNIETKVVKLNEGGEAAESRAIQPEQLDEIVSRVMAEIEKEREQMSKDFATLRGAMTKERKARKELEAKLKELEK